MWAICGQPPCESSSRRASCNTCVRPPARVAHRRPLHAPVWLPTCKAMAGGAGLRGLAAACLMLIDEVVQLDVAMNDTVLVAVEHRREHLRPRRERESTLATPWELATASPSLPPLFTAAAHRPTLDRVALNRQTGMHVESGSSRACAQRGRSRCSPHVVRPSPCACGDDVRGLTG